MPCKEMVSGSGRFGSFHQHKCTKPEWKDGWCKVHHPESYEKRYQESLKREEENRKQTPLYKARERIKELEAEIALLKGESK